MDGGARRSGRVPVLARTTMTVTSLAATLLVSGCTQMAGETAIPAADLGRAPAPVAVPALEGLLLPAEQLDSVLQVQGLVVEDTSAEGFSAKTSADDCAAAWNIAWLPMYTGSGWMAMRLQVSQTPDENHDHRVWQAVVSFPLPVDAAAFYAKQVAAWRTCNDRRFEQRYLDEAPDPSQFFVFGQASEHDGVLVMGSRQENEPTWGCEHSLTARNNVIADVKVCGEHLMGQAESVATAIAAKVPVT